MARFDFRERGGPRALKGQAAAVAFLMIMPLGAVFATAGGTLAGPPPGSLRSAPALAAVQPESPVTGPAGPAAASGFAASRSPGFLANEGRLADRNIRFETTQGPIRVAFTDDGLLVALRMGGSSGQASKPVSSTNLMATPAQLLHVRFAGSGHSVPVGRHELAYRTNYFIGNDPALWRTGVRSFGEVVYPAVYPGIDAVFHVAGGGIKYEFQLSAGADLGSIEVVYEGTTGLSASPAGELVIQTPAGELREEAPTAFEAAGEPVACAFQIRGLDAYGFACAKDASAGALTIDPLLYATYLGGSGDDFVGSVAADAAGDAYVCGHTQSSDFPTAPAGGSALNGSGDAFVSKFSADGSGLLFSTYIGGTGDEAMSGDCDISVDPNGVVYLAGDTSSTDFPATPGAYQTAFGGGGRDVFIVKLAANGSNLSYSSYLGGSLFDQFIHGLAVDAGGGVYIGAFPGSGHAENVMVAKLNASGAALDYVTWMNGSEYDNVRDVALDPSDNLYVFGCTKSTDFPTTPGVFDRVLNGTGVFSDLCEEDFVFKLDSGGSLVWSTFVGSSGIDDAFGVATDAAGDVIVAGSATGGDLLNTTGSIGPSLRGSKDAYVIKINPNATAVIRSTYLGGSGDEWTSFGLVIDAQDRITVAGTTNSNDFPTTADAWNGTNRGSYDLFVATLSPGLDQLLYSTYYGGSGVDQTGAIAVTPGGDALITGYSQSSDLPTTAGAFDSSLNGSYDAFVLKIRTLAPPPPNGSVSTDFGSYACGDQVNITVRGNASSTAALQIDDPAASPYLYAAVPTNASGVGLFNFTLAGNIGSGTYEVYASFPGAGPYRTNFAVNCTAPSQAPVARITGLNSTDVNASLNLSGSASSDDIAVVNWTWTIEDPLGNATLYAANISYTWTVPGNYTVRLEVRDGDNLTGNDSMLVEVRALVPPVAAIAGPTSVIIGEAANFSGSNSTDDRGVANWTWTFQDLASSATLFGANVSYTWLVPGNYSVRLVVRDTEGLTNATTIVVEVQIPPPPPLPIAVIAGPNVTDPGVPAVFSGANSTPASSLVNWTWTFEDAGSSAARYGATTPYTWLTKGDYNVSLTVRDGLGRTNTSTARVHVRDLLPPTAVITVTKNVEKGQALLLDGSLSRDEDGGPVVNWTWEIAFENGTQVLYGDKVNYTWASEGFYDVKLTVRDPEGNTGNDTQRVRVTVPQGHGANPPWIIIVVGGAAALGVLAALATNRGLFAAMTMLAVPLYARIRKEDLKGQETRAKILQYVSENPGSNYNEIKRGLELPNGTCSYHLRVLERVDEVRRVPEGLSVRFFLADVPSGVREAFALPDIQRDILWVLIEKGELSLSQVTKELASIGQKADASTVNYHLRTLQRKHHLIETRREEGLTYYSVPYERVDAVTLMLSKADARIEAALAKRKGSPGGTSVMKATLSPEISVEQAGGEVTLDGGSAAAAAAASRAAPAPAKGARMRSYLVEEVFVIYRDGRLMRSVGREDLKSRDPQIVAGMLTAIQDFVKDSIKGEGALSAMEYEEYRIYVNGGTHLFVAATVFGEADADLREELSRATTRIESLFAGIVEEWDGDVEAVRDIAGIVTPIIDLTRGLSRNDVTRLTTMSPVSVLSALDFASGFVRLKVGLRNNTSTVITDCRLEIENDETALRLDHIQPDLGRKEVRVSIGNLQGFEKKTVEFYFDPQTCMESFIDGVLRYRDIHGNLKFEKMKRRPVEVVCPIFFTTQNANTAMLKRLIEDDLKAKDRKLFRFSKDAEPAKVFELAREVALTIDVRAVRDFTERAPFRGEAWFYGETKVNKRRVVIRVSVDAANLLEFFVAAETDAEVAGLLAEFQRRLTEAFRAQRHVPGEPEPVQDGAEKERRQRQRTLLDRHLEGEAPSGDNAGAAP